MMRYSHRHARCLWRFLCPPVRLYTEMISTEAVLNGDTARLLTLPQGQSPVALQLGGAKRRLWRAPPQSVNPSVMMKLILIAVAPAVA